MVQKPLTSTPTTTQNPLKKHLNNHLQKHLKRITVLLQKQLQNEAKRPLLERTISTRSAPWTPLGTKHVQRRPKDTKITETVTSKLQQTMKQQKQMKKRQP